MEIRLFQESPHFKSNFRQLKPQECLFQQGQLGQSMFLILKGVVRLLCEDDGGSHWMALVVSGEFLGERSLFRESAYQRKFTAQALTPVVALEITPDDLMQIQLKAPALLVELLKGVVETASNRLEKANYLNRVLRSHDNSKRFIELLLFLCRTMGAKTAKGTHLFDLVDTMTFHLEVPRKQIEKYIEGLIQKKLIEHGGKDEYLVLSEAKLEGLLQDLPAEAA